MTPRVASAATIVAACLAATPAGASNFGDFPAVVPFLYLTPFVCLAVGVFASLKRNERGEADGVDRRRLLWTALLTAPAWWMLCFLGFLTTL